MQHQQTTTPDQDVPAADQVTTSASNTPDIIPSLVDKGQSSPVAAEDTEGHKEKEIVVASTESENVTASKSASGTEANSTPSLEYDKPASQEGTNISSSTSGVMLSTVDPTVNGSPVPVEQTSQQSSAPSGDESQSKEHQGIDNEGGKEPGAPQTPTGAGQLGGMFTRLRKAWQGGEAKVS